MYRRILVPVDGSSTSELGLKQALGLAKDQRARVRVLNVLDQSVMVPGMDDYAAVDMSAIIDVLESEGKKALKQAAALAARSKVRSDTAMLRSRGHTVSDVILDEAKKWRADLIVMGTHGRRGFNRLLLGSDAERVLREAPVPVLLVRGEHAKRRRTRKR